MGKKGNLRAFPLQENGREASKIGLFQTCFLGYS